MEQISWPTMVCNSWIIAVSLDGALKVKEDLWDTLDSFIPVKEIVFMFIELAYSIAFRIFLLSPEVE